MYGVCVCLTGPDTIIASEDYLGVRRKGNPPYNVEDNQRIGLLVIESQVQGILREFWIKGSSASGLLSMSRTDGL